MSQNNIIKPIKVSEEEFITVSLIIKLGIKTLNQNNVKAIDIGEKLLKWCSENYEALDGGLIRFFDFKIRKYKIFDSRLCEIEEVGE